MKKFLPFYAIGWAFALGLFNLITFITPGDKFDDTLFTISYILITLFFFVLLACAWYVSANGSAHSTLYRLPLIKKSAAALIAMLIVGSVFMAIDILPTWLGVIIAAVVVFLNILPILKVGAAAGIVEKVDSDIKQQTAFTKILIADAQILMSRAQGTVNDAVVRQIYEAARYSDPMSSQGLMDVETRIRTAFNALSIAVANGEEAQAQAKEVLQLIEERNIKCKILK